MKTLDELSFAHRFDTISGSAIREILKLTMQSGMISFAGGNPARSALPGRAGQGNLRKGHDRKR